MNDTLLTGGTVTASYQMVRSDYNPAYFLPDPAYGSTVSISVAQPLLQGAGTDYNRAAIESAKLGVTISNLNFKSTVLTIIFNVETTYYNLLYQREQYKVQQDTLKQAQQLLDENTQKRQTGVLTDLDVMNARAGVATAQNQLILDEQAVHNSVKTSSFSLLGDREFKSAFSMWAKWIFRTWASPTFPSPGLTSWPEKMGPTSRWPRRRSTNSNSPPWKAKRNTLPLLNVNGGLGYNFVCRDSPASRSTGSWSEVTIGMPG